MEDTFEKYGWQRQHEMTLMTATWGPGEEAAQAQVLHTILHHSRPEHADVAAPAVASAAGCIWGNASCSAPNSSTQQRRSQGSSSSAAAHSDTNTVDPFSTVRLLLAIGDITASPSVDGILNLPRPPVADLGCDEDASLPRFASAAKADAALCASVQSSHTQSVQALLDAAASQRVPGRQWCPSPFAAHILLDVALSEHIARGQ